MKLLNRLFGVSERSLERTLRRMPDEFTLTDLVDRLGVRDVDEMGEVIWMMVHRDDFEHFFRVYAPDNRVIGDYRGLANVPTTWYDPVRQVEEGILPQYLRAMYRRRSQQ